MASVLVPFPHAVDDHQTANARHLAEAGAAWLLPQSQLSARSLADLIAGMDRARLVAAADKARALARPDATARLAAACVELAR